MTDWRVYRRIAKRLGASPIVGLPIGLGAATWLAAMMLGDASDFLAFLGVSGVLFGLGAAATLWVLDGRRLHQQASEQYRDESNHDHERFLDDLDRRLLADNDQRTNQHLRVLLRLHQRMRRAGLFDVELPLEILPDVREKVERLYRSCLSSLERSLVLWNAAQEMMTNEAQARVLSSREAVIQEVGDTIHHLGATLDYLLTAQLETDADENLRRMRAELEFGLDVARRVDERMQSLEDSLRSDGLADNFKDF
jgi:hypothetical protein